MVAIAPDFAPGWAALGAVLFDLGEIDRSVDSLQRSLDLADDDVRSNLEVARAAAREPAPAEAGIADSSETPGGAKRGRAACDASAHAGRAAGSYADRNHRAGLTQGWPEPQPKQG